MELKASNKNVTIGTLSHQSVRSKPRRVPRSATETILILPAIFGIQSNNYSKPTSSPCLDSTVLLTLAAPTVQRKGFCKNRLFCGTNHGMVIVRVTCRLGRRLKWQWCIRARTEVHVKVPYSMVMALGREQLLLLLLVVLGREKGNIIPISFL